jgi:hypothetical protein
MCSVSVLMTAHTVVVTVVCHMKEREMQHAP